MYSDFIFGFIFGSLLTLGIIYAVAFAYSRIARVPAPTGVVYAEPVTTPLPFTVTNEARDAKTEREFLDHVPGLGR
jgi:hypothetical protein